MLKFGQENCAKTIAHYSGGLRRKNPFGIIVTNHSSRKR